MSFLTLEIRDEYRSFSNDIVSEFYIPVLSNAVKYQRAVGFFSSSALIDIAKGIAGLVRNEGKIELIASPKLSKEDIDAIEQGLASSDEVITEKLLEAIEQPQDDFNQKRFDLLVNLLAAKKLEIKIALIEKKNSIGMYHEKLGLVYDKEDNVIAFTGSMNESDIAFNHNYESVDVFRSWGPESSRVEAKVAAFQAMWEDYAPAIRIIDFPTAAKEKLLSYRETEKIDISFLEEETKEMVCDENDDYNRYCPKVPDEVSIRDYQNEAIAKWQAQDYRGIFDMATGTGKTFTGLAAVAQLYKNNRGKLAVLIVCPYQHLVEQWVEDIRKFGMRPIICYSASKQKNWKTQLKRSVRDFKFGIENHFCAIFTNATFASEYVQDEVNKLSRNTLLVIDEAHNFGATNYSKMLPQKIEYRLALSATIERYEDKDGTQKLFDYFGDKCIEYTLKEAIQSGMLTPYLYYPVVVNFDEQELADYLEITKQIVKAVGTADDLKNLSDYAKMLLIKRARIVASAKEKVFKLQELMRNYSDKNHILVYCGATTIQDIDYVEGKPVEDEIRQIDAVTKILGNELNMNVAKFTSEESNQERMVLKEKFDEGDYLQALVAIRCLDEGVNIPSIETAFILSSSTNPKEYVQRRGRVLRKYPGKNNAVIYDFILEPIPTENIDSIDPEVVLATKSLVKKEIMRMRDFADISDNPSDVDKLVQELSEAYGINIYEEEDIDEY